MSENGSQSTGTDRLDWRTVKIVIEISIRERKSWNWHSEHGYTNTKWAAQIGECSLSGNKMIANDNYVYKCSKYNMNI